MISQPVFSTYTSERHAGVKMDVEGHEMDEKRFFTRGTPQKAVYAEVFQLGTAKPVFYRMMKSWGYQAMSAKHNVMDELLVRETRVK